MADGRRERYRGADEGLLGELSMSSSSSESLAWSLRRVGAALVVLDGRSGGAGRMTEGVALTLGCDAGRAASTCGFGGEPEDDRRVGTLDRFESGGVLNPPTNGRSSARSSVPDSRSFFAVGVTAAVEMLGIDALDATLDDDVGRVEGGAGVIEDRGGFMSMTSSNEWRGLRGRLGATELSRAAEVAFGGGGGVGVGVAC